MIKWLSGSRLKTGTENESSPYTNNPLAIITGVNVADGKCHPHHHIYAVSRVNPLFTEEVETGLKDNSDGSSDQRLSPRKSISSGYESRCNSSSDSSSCTESEEKHFKKPVPSVKREKRLTKQNKSDKKKRGDYEKWETGAQQISVEDPKANPSNLKRRTRKLQNGTSSVLSNLSTIPEGKVDCSIPPPIWPRIKGNISNIGENSNFYMKAPSRNYHNGSTNPVNFMFKYNERYPKCCNERNKTLGNYFDRKTQVYNALSVKTEYEHNWVECCESQCGGPSCFEDIEDSVRYIKDKTSPYTPDRTLDRLPVNRNELAEEVLRDLANLIAFAMSNKNYVTLGSILKSLADSFQKSLEVLSQTESEEDLKVISENLQRNKYLGKILAALLSHDGVHQILTPKTGDDDNNKNIVNTSELTQELQKVPLQTRNPNDDLTAYNIKDQKDDIYSSGSEGKNSSSSSSGCKDLYMSSNSSSSASKDIVFISSSFDSVVDRDKPYSNNEKSLVENNVKDDEGNHQDGGILNRIHHQRDFSSSSTESAFGSSDISPPPSDSSSAKDILNPVFLHDDIYSVPKSVRNAMIGETLNRTKNADCGSVRNCGSSAFEKLISAKRKTSHDSHIEEIGPLAYADEGKTRLSSVVMTSAKVDNTVLKKVEHPYYVAIGRPDFTLDLPQAERLMKKIASSKRRRCWCRFMTSIFGLAFFLLSVMMVSLVITKGRRMFGAL